MTSKPEKPQILEPLHDVIVCEGETVVLSTQVSGNPPAEVAWFKNDKPITDIPEKVEETVHSITLSRPSPLDSAKYSIVATNSMGTAKSICNVIVESKLQRSHFSSLLSMECAFHISLYSRNTWASSPSIYRTIPRDVCQRRCHLEINSQSDRKSCPHCYLVHVS